MGLALKAKHFFLCVMHVRECIGHPFTVETGQGFVNITGLRFYNPDKVHWNT